MSPHRRVTTAARRALARQERKLFGTRRRSVSRNDQYLHLWQRILVELAQALCRRHRGADVKRLDGLAQKLERAQQRERLPPGLVRQIDPRSRHGSLRQTKA